MKRIVLFFIITLSLAAGEAWQGVSCTAQTINTIAGNGTLGYNGDGIPALNAWFSYPAGVALDPTGNIYITDMNNCRIRKMDIATGLISTIAGNGAPGFSGDGGPASAAMLSNYVIGITYSAGYLYIADGSDNCIRKINLTTSIITTIAGTGSFSGGYSGDGGPAAASQLNYPVAVAVSSTGYIYIADCYNHRVRKINVSTGVITTAAGTGVMGATGDGGLAASAKLNYPAGVACDAAGNVYISDNGNNKIRKITVSTGIITTIAGTGAAGATGDGGSAIAARLQNPQGITFDANGNIYFADGMNYRIRKITISTGIISLVAGTSMGFSGDGGPATSAQLDNANGLTTDAAGNIYIADAANQRIRKIVPATPPLPVDFISFNGLAVGNVNHLSWTTASEINNDYFDMERSPDGIIFESIGKVQGHGNSVLLLNYSYNDESPLKGLNYYRLRQVDYNGAFVYSAIVALSNKIAEDYHLYSLGNSSYLLSGAHISTSTISIGDAQGNLIRKAGLINTGNDMLLNLSGLADGIYFVRITGSERMQCIRLLKY